ncbi:hypothetical protein [Streptomyces sp. NPDC054797]
MLTRYGQELGLPIVMVESWMGRKRSVYSPLNDAELSELLGPDLRHLVVTERRALRLVHPLIAEHILNGEIDGERYSLGKISVDFIRKTTSLLGPENRTTARLLNELFIRRTSSSANGQTPDNFTELIESMSVEAGAEVFEVLTTQCPNNAHFWNHRGRYDIYKVKADFARAEGFVLKAVEKSHGRHPIHLHTLGKVRRFWIENKLSQILRDGERRLRRGSTSTFLETRAFTRWAFRGVIKNPRSAPGRLNAAGNGSTDESTTTYSILVRAPSDLLSQVRPLYILDRVDRAIRKLNRPGGLGAAIRLLPPRGFRRFAARHIITALRCNQPWRTVSPGQPLCPARQHARSTHPRAPRSHARHPSGALAQPSVRNAQPSLRQVRHTAIGLLTPKDTVHILKEHGGLYQVSLDQDSATGLKAGMTGWVTKHLTAHVCMNLS